MNHLLTAHLRAPKRLPLAVFLALGSTGAIAEQTSLAPILIEGTSEQQTTGSAVMLDKTVLDTRQRASGDTASLLLGVPGVSLNAAGGVSSLPSIHGLADDRLRIKVDGMDLIATCPNHMNPPLSYLDPSSVEALDVYAGIAPVSLGGDSIGGSIVARTADPEFASAGETLTHGSLGARYASNGDARRANLSLTHASDNVSVNYTGSWSQADNYSAADSFKTSTATGRVGHALPLDEVGSTAYESFNHALNLAIKGEDRLLEAKLGYQNVPYELYPNQRMDLLDNTQKRINLGYQQELAWGGLEVRAYHEKVDHFMDFGDDKRYWYGSNSQPPAAAEIGTPCTPIRFFGDPAGTCAAGMPMYSESRTNGASVQGEVPLSGDDTLRVGGELQFYRLDDYWTASGGGMGPGTFLNINNGKRDRIATYAEWERQAGDKWLTLLGVRYERVHTDADNVEGYDNTAPAPGNQIADAAAFNALDHSKYDNNVDLTALAHYSHSDTLDIEFGVARKVRSPNLYERYTWSTWSMAATMNNFVGDGNGYVGDVNLKPEKAHTVSATLDWHAADNSWQLKATPYYTRVQDYIDAIAGGAWAANQFNVLTYTNQSARLYGIDVSGHLPLGHNALGDWRLLGVLSYTDGKNLDSGDPLYNVMPLNATFTLRQSAGDWDNAAELTLVDAKDDLSTVRNEIGTGGYALVNLRASRKWRNFRFDFGVENLLDTAYNLPTGGAYTGQGSTMSMNGIPWGVAIPGPARSLYAGFNMTF